MKTTIVAVQNPQSSRNSGSDGGVQGGIVAVQNPQSSRNEIAHGRGSGPIVAVQNTSGKVRSSSAASPSSSSAMNGKLWWAAIYCASSIISSLSRLMKAETSRATLAPTAQRYVIRRRIFDILLKRHWYHRFGASQFSGMISVCFLGEERRSYPEASRPRNRTLRAC